MFNYEYLPDGMKHEDVRRCFTEFLFDYQNIASNKRLYAFEQLLEISNRETYQMFDEPILNAASDFILSNIDFEDFDIMDIVLSIVPTLGLVTVWENILQIRTVIKNNKVRKLIDECKDEYGDTVEDPYSSYKNL